VPAMLCPKVLRGARPREGTYPKDDHCHGGGCPRDSEHLEDLPPHQQPEGGDPFALVQHVLGQQGLLLLLLRAWRCCCGR
jgi:hypothetical protein